MATATNTDKKEIARRGQAIYDERIRHKVEAEHRGKFLAVDIESGDYEIDAESLAAFNRAREKNADAVLYLVRIGYRTAYSLGGRLQVQSP